VPEGDSLRRVAERVRVLEGMVVSVEAPHPRAAALGIAERLDGRRLERVEAVGKNLVLTFEGGLVLRSHLRMRGRWQVQAAGERLAGTPWLVLRGGGLQAVQWNGPVLELGARRVLERLGPDIMDEPPDLDSMLRRFRTSAQGREIGEALLDQNLVAGIGNVWRAGSPLRGPHLAVAAALGRLGRGAPRRPRTGGAGYACRCTKARVPAGRATL